MKAGYTGEKMILDKLTVYGMLVTPKSVTVNGKGAQFQYNSPVKVLLTLIYTGSLDNKPLFHRYDHFVLFLFFTCRH